MTTRQKETLKKILTDIISVPKVYENVSIKYLENKIKYISKSEDVEYLDNIRKIEAEINDLRKQDRFLEERNFNLRIEGLVEILINNYTHESNYSQDSMNDYIRILEKEILKCVE